MTPLLIPLLTWEQVLPPILGILFSGGLVGTILTYRLGKKKQPIDSATAAAAISERAGHLALAIAETQRKDIDALRRDLGQQRTDMNAVAAELAKRSEVLDRTRQEVRALIHGIREWYDHKIVAHWEVVRLQPVPPDPPVEIQGLDHPYSSLLDG